MLFKKHHEKRNILLLVSFLCLFSASQVFARAQTGASNSEENSSIPEGVKGKRIKTFISAVNANDPEQVREFFEKNCTDKFKNFAPMSRHVSVFRNVYQSTGGLEFQGVDSQAPAPENAAAVILKGRIMGTFRVTFLWSKEKIIDGLMIQPANPSDTDTGPALTEEQFLQKIKELMTKLIDNDMFSGTILVARGKKVLFTLAGGEASKRFHVPNNIDTKLNLGSMKNLPLNRARDINTAKRACCWEW